MRNPVLDPTPTGLPKDTVSSLRPVFFSTINISFFCALPICKPTCIIFHIQKWILAFISPSRYSHISLLLLTAKSSKELIIIAFIFSIPICSRIHSDDFHLYHSTETALVKVTSICIPLPKPRDSCQSSSSNLPEALYCLPLWNISLVWLILCPSGSHLTS